MSTRTKKLVLSAGFAVGALVASAPEAHAIDWVIKQPSAHPAYRAELEPHLNLLLYRAGWGVRRYSGYGTEVGAGFRASIELGDPLFIPSINNTIAITFGLDTNSCRYSYCGRNNFELWSPVALQWNFFLTRKWSAFAEFGGIVHSYGFFSRGSLWVDPTVFLGTRIHFNDKVALTFRVGSPWIGIGVSFFVGS